jgi:hypothetical protein
MIDADVASVVLATLTELGAAASCSSGCSLPCARAR